MGTFVKGLIKLKGLEPPEAVARRVTLDLLSLRNKGDALEWRKLRSGRFTAVV